MRWMGILIAAAGLVLLVLLFLLLRPDPAGSLPATSLQAMPPAAPDTTTPPLSVTPVAEPVSQASAESEPIPLVRIEQGHRVEGPATLRVQQGDRVRLRFLADTQQELHLHGYDRSLQLEPGEESLLEFDASLSGRFEYELHGHQSGGHAALGVIEVYPR